MLHVGPRSVSTRETFHLSLPVQSCTSPNQVKGLNKEASYVMHQLNYTARIGTAVESNSPSSNLALHDHQWASEITASIYLPVSHALSSIAGLPKPTSVRITTLSNASLTITWNYPPPPADPISNFYVCDQISIIQCRHFLLFVIADHLLGWCRMEKPWWKSHSV